MSPKERPTKPVAIYTRVSEQGRRSDEELLSHDLQRGKVEKYLEARGIPALTAKFEDTDKSGGEMSRPQFDRAIEGVISGKYGGIAVARLSRFGRTTSGVLTLIAELEKAGGAVICLDPAVDTSTASGRAMLTVFLAFVTMEREQAIEQAALTAELKLARGEALGGKPPLGYRFDVIGQDTNGKELHGNYVRDEPAAGVVAEAFEKFDRREIATIGRVADFLNAAGLRTRATKKHPEGQLWSINNVRSLLRNESYTSVRKYGEQRIENAHEVIVPADVFRRVQRRLEPKAGPKTRVRGEGHVLGQGLMRCGHCGGALSRSVANGKYAILRCNERGSGHAAISLPTAEEYVIEVAFAHSGIGAIIEGGNSEEMAEADRRLELARAELAEVEALRGTVGAASFALAHSDAVAARDAAEAARDELEPQGGTLRMLFPLAKRELFDALEMPEKRAALKSIVKRAIVAPGRVDVSERITIEFQDGEWHPAHRAPDYVWKTPAAVTEVA